MMSPIAADLRDIAEAIPDLGALVLLRGRCATQNANKLVEALYPRLYALVIDQARLRAQVETLTAEIDGLRNQNEILTNLADSDSV